MSPNSGKSSLLLCFLIFTISMFESSCQTNSYIWSERASVAAEGQNKYLIRIGDELLISVWQQEQLSTSATVREDGKITIPLIGDIPAENLEPSTLRRNISTMLSNYILDPEVTVSITSSRKRYVSVIGEINQAGKYELDHGEHILHLIAKAGGLTEFADLNSIYLIRKNTSKRIRFRFSDLSNGNIKSLSIKLTDGDIIYID